jgi:hypothetical protein
MVVPLCSLVIQPGNIKLPLIYDVSIKTTPIHLTGGFFQGPGFDGWITGLVEGQSSPETMGVPDQNPGVF